MIRIKLRSLLEEKSFREQRKIQLVEISERTGISRATLTRIINQPGYSTNLETVDALCEFLDCQPGDLLEFVPNMDTGDEGDS